MSQPGVAHSNYSKTTKFRYKPMDPNDPEQAACESSDSSEEIDTILENEILESMNRQFAKS